MAIKSRLYPKILFSALSLAIFLLGFYITKPFLPTLVTGAIIAYLSYPLYCKALRRIKSRKVASFVIAVLIVLLFTVPFIAVIGLISKEAILTYRTLNQQNLGTNFFKIVCKDETWVSCRMLKSFVGFLPQNDLDYYLHLTIEKITGFVIQNASGFLISIPAFFFNLLIMAFIVYYLLIDAEEVTKRIKNILPLKEVHKQHVLKKFHSMAYSVFYGSLLVAVIQGALGAIGFLVLGIPSPFLWGFVMMVLGLMPYIGTAIVWLPASLNLIFIGYLQNDGSSAIRGIILIVYGVLVISSIDNFLKPRIIGAQANAHPILVLLGVLGGLKLFGFIGMILGPVVLALVMTVIDIYEDEKAELEKYF